MTTNTLQSYNQEIQPNIRKLMEKQDALKEWAKENGKVLELKAQIKELQDELKAHIENTESELVREINDLQTDIKLAIKGMSKGSAYKPAELKAYLFARAKEAVDKTLEKAELFEALNKDLM